MRGLPEELPAELFPVTKQECDGPPEPLPQCSGCLWCGDRTRYVT
jgi:hypothetical protein